MLDYNGLEFHWTGHDGFRIVDRASGKTVWTDPYKLSSAHQNKKDADILLISHNHFDHLSIDDLKHVTNEKTIVVAAEECVDKLKPIQIQEVKGVKPGDKLTVNGISIEVIAAYNTNKQFHPKADGKVGFIITLNGMRVYHTGDADDIPEMKGTNPDIALVPVSGTYVMTAKEAANAINEKIKPKKLAIPMHYNSIVGSEKDAEEFKGLVKVCEVKILDSE